MGFDRELGPENNGFLSPTVGEGPQVFVVWVGDRTSFPWSTYAANSSDQHLSYWALEGWPSPFTLAVRAPLAPPEFTNLPAFENKGFAPATLRPTGLPIDPALGDRWYKVDAATAAGPIVAETWLQVRATSPRCLTWYRRGQGGGTSLWGNTASPGRTLTLTLQTAPAALPQGFWSVTVENEVVV